MIQKRILIVRQDRIGDVIVSTPMPREVKKKWPDAFVAVLVKNYTKDIFINNPYVDEIITIEDLEWKGIKEFFRSVKKIRRYKFTHAFMLLPTQKINYLLFFSGIRYRIGVGKKFFQFITFVKSVDRHKYNPLRHEADYSMDQARKIGIKTKDISTEIHLSDAEKDNVEKIKLRWSAGSKHVIGLNISSGNSAPNLIGSDYLNLINKLMKNKNYKIVITDNDIPPKLKNLEGVEYPNISSSLRNSIINFASLDCLISSSTGPMHTAAALGVKTISMFCNLTACSPKLWGPLGNPHKIIQPQKNYCGQICPGDPHICTFNGQFEFLAENIIQSLNEFFSPVKHSLAVK